MNLPFWITLLPISGFIIFALSLLWEDPKYDYVSGENRRIHKETGEEQILCGTGETLFGIMDQAEWVNILRLNSKADIVIKQYHGMDWR